MSYPTDIAPRRNHAFRPVYGSQMHNSSYIHFDTKTRSKGLQTLGQTHVSTISTGQCPTPTAKAGTKQAQGKGGRGSGYPR